MSLLGATLLCQELQVLFLQLVWQWMLMFLIFARIREELKEKDPQIAINDGFSRAFVTIFDANVTTLIAA